MIAETGPELVLPGLAAGAEGRPRARAGALLRCARPRQWVKNALVVAVPFASGHLAHTAVAWRTLVVLVAFTAVSAGTYFLNDARDVQRDRLHPTKRRRPVAAGEVTVRTAVLVGALLVAAGLAAAAVCGVACEAVVAGYVVVTAAYTFGLKHVPWLEMLVVAAGFVLRALAGGAATHLPVTAPFLVVVGAGSASLVLGKRFAEARELGVQAATHRPSLRRYPPRALAALVVLAAVILVGAYAVWAAHRSAESGRVLDLLDVVPVAGALLRYGQLLRAGGGSAPEELLAGDRWIRLAVVVWITVFACGMLP